MIGGKCLRVRMDLNALDEEGYFTLVSVLRREGLYRKS